MVDTVGYTEPLHERPETDAAGDDQDRRAVESLRRGAQPAQKLIDSTYMVIVAEHPLEEYWQLVDDQEHPLVVCCALVYQPIPMAPPRSRIQPRSKLHPKIACTELLYPFSEPAHRGSQA